MLLDYDTTSTTAMAGFQFKPDDAWELGVDAFWNDADAAIDPFDFVVPARFENANQSYDFTLTHLNSDLDVSRLELASHVKYRFTPRYWIDLGYRYADYDDDAPYITDDTGSIGIYSLAFGHRF